MMIAVYVIYFRCYNDLFKDYDYTHCKYNLMILVSDSTYINMIHLCL